MLHSRRGLALTLARCRLLLEIAFTLGSEKLCPEGNKLSRVSDQVKDPIRRAGFVYSIRHLVNSIKKFVLEIREVSIVVSFGIWRIMFRREDWFLQSRDWHLVAEKHIFAVISLYGGDATHAVNSLLFNKNIPHNEFFLYQIL